MRCPACGTENEAGRKFCGECGGKLALVCPGCSAPNTPGMKFCGECGARLDAEAPAGPREAPQAERRLVSVLFADLVGFTTLSETRDAEEVRELLSRYFEDARRVIERFGGTVEKFIGDAVMAVWGAPVANEDDAERAVRAGSRPRRGRHGARRGGRRARPRGPRGRPDRRGGGHARRGGPGHGRRRPRQHRLAGAGDRRAGHRARGRGNHAGPRRPRSSTRTPGRTS